MLTEFIDREWLHAGNAGDDGTYPFAARRVGQPDDGHVADLRVFVDQILDFLRTDVLALANDDVLEPAGDHHVAVGIEMPDVARAEETVLVECRRSERRVDVP